MHINLLLIGDDEGNFHYCLITDLARLISNQLSKHNGKKFLCDGCLQFFNSKEKLCRHNEVDCDFVKIILPSEDLKLDKFGNNLPSNILKFDNIQNQMEVPFVVYSDFECILKPTQDENMDNLNLNLPFTKKTVEHIPYSFAFYIKCSFDNNISKFVSYRGENCAQVFINELEKEVLRLYTNHLQFKKPMEDLDTLNKYFYDYIDECHICNKRIPENDKVADHDHLTGSFRGPAHSNCNLHFKLPNYIPIVFHNLRNYDSHLFIKKLCENKEQLSVIAQNKEKYISFSKILKVGTFKDKKTGHTKQKFLNLRFIDSFQFLPFSLSNLAETLEDNQCNEIRKYFNDQEKFKYIRQKGVFPYKYIDNLSKLNDTKLPNIEEFYNELTDEHITVEEYKRAKYVWSLFSCKDIGEYSDIYLKSDILLLADIFQNFRKTCLNIYKLDPAHYYTFPGLSMDACLKYTGVELELLTDPDMLHFYKNNIRGGVSTCVTRKSVANNLFLSSYDPSQPTKYLMYFDATNLYGFAMSQYLPEKDFVWLTDISKFTSKHIMNISDNSEKGYVLEVDLEYPEGLHLLHNEFPFCPQNFKPPNSKNEKLIPNLYNKKNYVTHYMLLKQCLKYGLKLTKVHRVLEFTQSPWLKKYIDLNTELRNNSSNKFDKNNYKLANNSFYGKTMENVDKRTDIRLVTEWAKNKNKNGAENLIAKASFKDYTVFSENLVAIQLKKMLIKYDKPIYIGFSILDISKTVMYDFFYGFLKPMYKDNVKLLYTDTDSFILEILTENVYNDIKIHIDRFDTSNYKDNNIHEIPISDSVVGKFKDEYAGEVIECFYGTGAKAYCVKTEKNLLKKAKGIKKSSIKKQLNFTHYKDVVEKDSKTFCTMYVFRSRMRNMYTELLNKIALTSDDDKRFKIPHSFETLAWGHQDIPFYQWNMEHEDDF